jgi:hypothetical protein
VISLVAASKKETAQTEYAGKPVVDVVFGPGLFLLNEVKVLWKAPP